MATLDTSPQQVDLVGYAGDTLSFSVTAPTTFIAGRGWSAQVRSTVDAATVDAEFQVIAPTVVDGPAFLTLTADDTRALHSGGATATRVVGGRAVTSGTYSGFWDVQLAPAGGGDPVTTLVQGKITIPGDITRVAP
jgi:hypothetical protein